MVLELAVVDPRGHHGVYHTTGLYVEHTLYEISAEHPIIAQPRHVGGILLG